MTIHIGEAMKIPAARAALDKQRKSLWSMNTWLAETVAEYDEVRRKASRMRAVHFGRVFPICTLNGFALAEGSPAGNGKDELFSEETMSETKIATLLRSRT